MSENPLRSYDWYNADCIEREAKFMRASAERLVESINRLPTMRSETREHLRALDTDLTAALIVIGVALGQRDHVAVLQDHQEANALRLQAAE